MYDDKGDRIEETTDRKFFGWGPKEDEWISLTSPRIAPLKKMAKKLHKPSSQNGAEQFIEDSNDYLYQNFEKKK
jgi:hypothetical protein